MRFGIERQQSCVLSLETAQILRLVSFRTRCARLAHDTGAGRGNFQFVEAQLLAGSLVVTVDFLELGFGARQHIHAQFLMLGQRVTVRLLEVRQTVLQGFQFNPELVRFLCQELRRFTGSLGALLDVFIQKQRDQLLGNLVRDFWLLVLKAQAESDGHLPAPLHGRTDQGNANCIAHLFDLFGNAQPPAFRGKKIVFIDDPFQVLAGHHALANDFDALVGKGIVIRRHQIGEIC